ncbi:hypothetical protein ElyMa_003337600 [Elysia marginata]|uniref:Uncharacterized protein n=1 Tax=Elysia marginata TaxID=1093978 RepID=A0AAV4JG87_9GAST|nr:hypothetical protein ElyMa_003337600 [Elysia marginata]
MGFPGGAESCCCSDQTTVTLYRAWHLASVIFMTTSSKSRSEFAIPTQSTGKQPLQRGVSGDSVTEREQLLATRPSGGCMPRSEQQQGSGSCRLSVQSQVCVASVHLTLDVDPDPTQGCT